MAFPNKKPNTAMLLGVGPKPKPAGGPPPFGGAKAGSPLPPDDPTTPEAEPSSGGVTSEMLEYHPGGQSCGECSHFTAPGTCDRFPEPVEESGHCNGFEASDTGDQMPAADMGPQGMEPAA